MSKILEIPMCSCERCRALIDTAPLVIKQTEKTFSERSTRETQDHVAEMLGLVDSLRSSIASVLTVAEYGDDANALMRAWKTATYQLLLVQEMVMGMQSLLLPSVDRPRPPKRKNLKAKEEKAPMTAGERRRETLSWLED